MFIIGIMEYCVSRPSSNKGHFKVVRKWIGS